MTKTITLCFDSCYECPHFRCSAIWFAHCNHPDFYDIEYRDKRLPYLYERTFNIPKWCPLEDKVN